MIASKDQEETASSSAAKHELSNWMAVRKLEKTFDINLRDPRPNIQYSPLQDKCLQDYFNLSHVRDQLSYLGMVLHLFNMKDY
jgi:hypothetical protein